jgi:hypothetical protein
MYNTRPARRLERQGLRTALALTIAVSLMATVPAGLLAQDPTEAANATVAAEPSLAPAEAACQSADDLGLIMGFMLSIDVEEQGWVPVLVGTIAGLAEARTLVGLVGETYQPLVNDLIVSLESIRSTVGELDEMETTGARIVAIGETITGIGIAMDALSTQLRTSCSTD